VRQAFAGEGLGLSPDLVNYIGRQSQQGRTDPRILTSEDAQIAEAITGAVNSALTPVLTMEYVPERDGPATPEILTPSGSTDDYGIEELVAGSPSFDLGYPKIPGRHLEGIPNAKEMREKLRQRLLKNPGGAEDLPGFLRKA
jgi:hypothetical protein